MTDFQCADGQCVSNTSKCNGVSECFDNSDESADLCGRKISDDYIKLFFDIRSC